MQRLPPERDGAGSADPRQRVADQQVDDPRAAERGLELDDAGRVLGDVTDDRCVLAELSLHGPFHRIGEPLFFHREHLGRTTRQYASRQQRLSSIHPGRDPRFVFPHFRQFWEYLRAIHRAPLKWRQRLHCHLEMLKWVRDNGRRLLNDLKFFAYQICRPFRVALDAR